MASLEKYANIPQTTLNGSILAGAVSLVVGSASGFPTTGNFRIIIDNEIFIVTAVSGTTFTIQPGAEGTTQSGHTNGAAITGVLTAGGLAAGFQPSPIEPGGRLTITSNTPVLTADTTAQGTLYYCAFVHNWVPIYNGTSWTSNPLDTQLSLVLDSNAAHTGYQQSGNLFDVFYAYVAGTLYFGTSPAWTNSTTRAAAITLLNGIWVNNASMVMKFDNTASTITVPANQATLLGTMRATANGQTGVMMNPAAASGGSAAIVGVANVYNTVPINVKSRDSATSYTYATNTWRAMNNNANNSISYIDPLGEIGVSATVKAAAGSATATSFIELGINLNSTSATPATFAYTISGSTTLANNYKTGTNVECFPPTLGYNTLTAMENNTAATTTYNPVANIQCLTAELLY